MDDKYIYKVTAEAADGSGAMANYYVAPADAATTVCVPALVPKPGTINALNPMPLLPDLLDFRQCSGRFSAIHACLVRGTST